MLKVLRMVRVLKAFRELRLLLLSIVGSMTSLVWCFLLLGCVLYLFGIVFVQAVTSYLVDLTDAELELVRLDLAQEHPRAEWRATAVMGLRYWGTILEAACSL